jgi:hypothetical protein
MVGLWTDGIIEMSCCTVTDVVVVVYLGEPNSWSIKEGQNVLDRTESYAQVSPPVILSLALILNTLLDFTDLLTDFGFGTERLNLRTHFEGTVLVYGLLVGLKLGFVLIKQTKKNKFSIKFWVSTHTHTYLSLFQIRCHGFLPREPQTQTKSLELVLLS